MITLLTNPKCGKCLVLKRLASTLNVTDLKTRDATDKEFSPSLLLDNGEYIVGYFRVRDYLEKNGKAKGN